MGKYLVCSKARSSISIRLRDSIHLGKGISVHQRTGSLLLIISVHQHHPCPIQSNRILDERSMAKDVSLLLRSSRADCLGDSLRQARSHPVGQMVLLVRNFLVRRPFSNCMELCVEDFRDGILKGNITQFLWFARVSVILHKCVLHGFNIQNGKIGYTVHFLPNIWHSVYKIDNNCYGNITLWERFLTWPFVRISAYQAKICAQRIF